MGLFYALCSWERCLLRPLCRRKRRLICKGTIQFLLTYHTHLRISHLRNLSILQLRIFSIEVYEALFNSHTIAKTSVHELAHHIANIKYGPTSKHQKPFYVVLRELIYGALDAGILRIEHFTHDTNHRKVQKILREYIPCPSEGNRVRSVIEVRVGYKYKSIMTGKYNLYK